MEIGYLAKFYQIILLIRNEAEIWYNTTEENEAGGETLIINGGNAQGTKTFINSEFVVDQLK